MLKPPATGFPPAPSPPAHPPAHPQLPGPDEAARTLTRLFRQSIAADVYHGMFSRGEAFVDIDYEPSNRRKHPESLQALKMLSRHSMDEIRAELRLGPCGKSLSMQETKLLTAVVNSPWHFRHQTNGPVVQENGSLNILSSRRLAEKSLKTASNTGESDRSNLANDDFVFFGVEFTDQSKSGRLKSASHGASFYGHDAYMLPDSDPRVRFGYLTLTDHLLSSMEDYSHFDTERGLWPQKYHAMLDGIVDEVHSQDLTDMITDESQIFSAKDMKLGLALNAIQFLRKTDSAEFRSWVFKNAGENSSELHRTLNLLFQPEFHLPRMWSTHKHLHIGIGQASTQALLDSRNFRKLDQNPLNIADCTRHLLRAIRGGHDDLCAYLLQRPELEAIAHQPEAMGLTADGGPSIAAALATAKSPSAALQDMLRDKGLLGG